MSESGQAGMYRGEGHWTHCCRVVSPYSLSSSGLRKSLLQVALCSQGSFRNEIPEASSSLLRFRIRPKKTTLFLGDPESSYPFSFELYPSFSKKRNRELGSLLQS